MRLALLALLTFPLSHLACSSPEDNPSGAGGHDTGTSTENGSGGAGSTSGSGGGMSTSSGSGSSTSTASTGSTGSGMAGLIFGQVQRYDYAFDLASAHATSKLSIDVAPPGGDCFAASCALDKTSANTWNGAPAKSAALQGDTLTTCGEPVPGDAKLTIGAAVDVPEKTFLGLDVGFSRKQDMAGGQFTYLLSWVKGCEHFGPCDADPSRLAAFHFDVTHAPGQVVLCPGTLTPGSTLTQCDLSGTLAPTYSAFGLAADPLWKRAEFATVAGVNLAFYEVPVGKIAASLNKPSVTEFFTWITTLLGPLPYGKELRFAGAPTAWLGFEHPANIILNEQLPLQVGAYKDPTMHVLMHETVHQWAGDRATLASVPDFVWKEATAEYLAYVFEDEHRPAGEAAASLAYWDAISLQSQHYPRPTDSPTPSVESFYGDVYGPGPMVLYVQLESLLGRDKVLGGIQGFLVQPGARSADDLRKTIEAASGKDLKPYFDAWVFGSGKPEWPTFSVATTQTGDQVTVTVTQKNASKKLYGCKVEVGVQGATASALATVDFGVAPTSTTASATVTLSGPVKSTTLDPNHRVVGRLGTGGPLAPEPRRKVWIL